MKPPPPISQQSGTIRYQDLVASNRLETDEVDADEPYTPTVLESPPVGSHEDFDSPVTADLAASQQIAYWRIPPYRIDRLIGSGGLADVYLAYDENLRCEVAIKCLRLAPDCEDKLKNHTSLRLHESLRDETKRFLREWQALGALDHPNIVRARFAGESQGIPFLVMDYVKGGDLQSYLRTSGRPDFRQTVQWMIEACHGLEHAHNLGIVHRDLKPSNLLLDENVAVRLTDFGISHIEVPDEQSVTIPGVMMGTPDYVAPEQILCFAAADHRADIYSLGCTFFYVLFGYAPFEHRVTLAEKLAAHRNEIPSYDWHRTPLTPTQQAMFQSLLDRMLQKDPDHRPQETRIVLRELQAMLSGDDSDLIRKYQPPLRNTGAWVGPIAIAIVLSILSALAIAFVQWGQENHSQNEWLASESESSNEKMSESGEGHTVIPDERQSSDDAIADSVEMNPNNEGDEQANLNQTQEAANHTGDQSANPSLTRDQSNGIHIRFETQAGQSKFEAHETIRLKLTSELDGCFFLFRQDPFGRIELIHPNQFDGDNRVTQGVKSTIPSQKATWTLSAHPEPGEQVLFCIAFGNEPIAYEQVDLPPTLHEVLPSTAPHQWTSSNVRDLMDALRVHHRRYAPEQLYTAMIASQTNHARPHAISFLNIETLRR